MLLPYDSVEILLLSLLLSLGFFIGPPFQSFDTVGWVTGVAFGLKKSCTRSSQILFFGDL